MGLGLPLWGLFVVGLGFARDDRGHGLLFFFFFGGGFTGGIDGGFIGWWWWCQVCVMQ